MANLYRHSGKIGITGVLIPLFGTVPTLIGALLYAYAVVYIPIAGIVSLILLGAFIFLVGLSTGRIAKAAKCRNTAFLSLVTVGVALVGLYSTWVFFLYALIGKKEDPGVSFLFSLFLNPDELFSIIRELNRTGWYTIKGITPSGILLWIFWFLEALFLVVGSVFLSRSIIVRAVFCEKCNVWTKLQSSTRLELPEEWQVKIPDKPDHEALGAFEEADPAVQNHILAEVLQCPTCACQATRYTRVTANPDNKGKLKVVKTEIPGIVLT